MLTFLDVAGAEFFRAGWSLLIVFQASPREMNHRIGEITVPGMASNHIVLRIKSYVLIPYLYSAHELSLGIVRLTFDRIFCAEEVDMTDKLIACAYGKF